MENRKLNRRDFLRLSAAAATGAVMASCAPATPMVIEKEVIKEVPVEKVVIVEKEVPREVIKEVVVPKEVIKEVAVEKVVKETVEVEKVVVATRPAEKITIRWQDSGSELWMKVYTESLDKFHEDHPGITAKYEPNPDQWYEKTLVAMIGGTSPDMIAAWGDMFAAFYGKGATLNLTPYIDRDLTEEELADALPSQVEALRDFDTRAQIAWPRYLDYFILSYNKDVFDEVGVDYPEDGWTTDDVREAAKKVSGDWDNDGRQDHWGFGTWAMSGSSGSLGMLQVHARRWPGGGIVDPEDNANCLLDKPGTLESLEWLRAMCWDEGTIARPAQAAAFAEWIFLTGNEAMHDDHTAFKNFFETGLNFDITHFPGAPGGKSVGLSDCDGWCIWKGSRHKDAVWELLKHAWSRYVQDGIATVVQRQPARLSSMEKWEKSLIADYPAYKDFNWGAVSSQAMRDHGSPNWPHFKDAAGSWELIKPTIDSVLVTGTAPVSAFADVCEEIRALHRGG